MSRQYDNRGRDQNNFENVYGNVNIGRSRQRPEKEIIWLKDFEKEVEGRLATSLHNQILINLGKQAQPEQVHRLWDMEVKSGQISETIPPETEILEVFERPEIAGKLLILGKPGAGKTTTLLELARALVRKAIDDPSEPMPFLLNLSSWKDSKQSIKDWTIAELKTKGIGSKLGKKWLEDQKFLPLFDGLDEVRSDLQPACVSAINRFMSSEEQPRAIVVCSRREEYELYSEKLDLNRGIYLQELSDEQIEDYLGKVNRLALWQVLCADTELLKLVRQPLLLSITLVAYRDGLAQQWQALRSTRERLAFLLDAYVERMLHRRIESKWYASKKEPTAQQTRQWLVRLAKQLKKNSETEFLIERMQFAWLVNKWQWLFYLLPFGLVGSAVSIQIGLMIFGIVGGIIGGVVGLLGGLLLGLNGIEPAEKFQLSLRGIMQSQTIPHLSYCLSLGVMIGLSYGLQLGLAFGLLNSMWVVVGVVIVTSRAGIETRVRPNQGILSSAKFVMPMIFILIAVYQLLTHIFIQQINARVLNWLIGGLASFSFFKGGGLACVQHFSLRLVLFLNRAIPWNYARFLNYATERMFLQRVGGRYRFIHKLLQDHFAAMNDEA